MRTLRLLSQTGLGARRRAGFTLLEMLVVIAILAALLGIGAFAFRRMNQRMTEDAAANMLDTVIRQSRNSALASGAPAFVELDPGDPGRPARATPWGYRVVGMWHFEDTGGELKGAHRKNAYSSGAQPVDGRVGKGLLLGGPAHADCGDDPDFVMEDGGYLEAQVLWLNENVGGDQFVFRRKDAYSLAVARGGVLVGEVAGERLLSERYRLAPRRWTKVAFAWDARSSRLFVDDAVVAVGPGMTAPKKNDKPLLIGDEGAAIHGIVDEVRIMLAVRGAPLALPRGVRLQHNAQPWGALFFAPDGSLDNRYHTGAVRVDAVKGKKMRSVFVSMLGLTRRGEVESLEVLEEDEAYATPVAPPQKAQPFVPKLPTQDDGKKKEEEKKKPDGPLVAPSKEVGPQLPPEK